MVTGVCPCFLVFFFEVSVFFFIKKSVGCSIVNNSVQFRSAGCLNASLEDGLYGVILSPLGNNSSCGCHIDDCSISSGVGLGSTADPQVDLNELRNNREKLLLD